MSTVASRIYARGEPPRRRGTADTRHPCVRSRLPVRERGRNMRRRLIALARGHGSPIHRRRGTCRRDHQQRTGRTPDHVYVGLVAFYDERLASSSIAAPAQLLTPDRLADGRPLPGRRHRHRRRSRLTPGSGSSRTSARTTTPATQHDPVSGYPDCLHGHAGQRPRRAGAPSRTQMYQLRLRQLRQVPQQRTTLGLVVVSTQPIAVSRVRGAREGRTPSTRWPRSAASRT